MGLVDTLINLGLDMMARGAKYAVDNQDKIQNNEVNTADLANYVVTGNQLPQQQAQPKQQVEHQQPIWQTPTTQKAKQANRDTKRSEAKISTLDAPLSSITSSQTGKQDEFEKIEDEVTPLAASTMKSSNVFGGSEGGKIDSEPDRNELAAKIKGKDESSNDKLEDLRKQFKNDQQRDFNRAQVAVDNQIYSQYAMMGINPYDDPLYQRQAATELTEIPSTIADANRRFTDGEGRPKANPLDWNFFGVNSQQKTPQAARDLYEWLFSKEDAFTASERDKSKEVMTAGGGASVGEVDNTPWRTMRVNPLTGNSLIDPNLIDDGKTAQSREAAFMTGEQYKKYIDLGIPGRDPETIIDGELYNKQDEMEQYGFVPYLTSDEAVNKFYETTAPHTVSNIFNNLTDFRRNITDPTVNYEGDQFSYKAARQAYDNWNRQMAKSNNDKHKVIYENPGEFDIPQTLVMYDDNNERFVAPNAPINIEYLDDGQIIVEFNDNDDDDWVFDNEEQMKERMLNETAEDGEYIDGWLPGYEPLEIGNTKIRADKAQDFWANIDNYTDNDVHLGPVTLPNMAKQNPDELLENPADFLPWFVDMALSSAPYFSPYTAGIKGVGDTLASAQGMRPGYRNSDGTYSLISENPDFSDIASATVGSAIMPLTEHLWGPLGKTIFKASPTKALLSKVLGEDNKLLNSIPGKLLTGASDEGLEEIPGNAVEQLIENGTGWYADPVYQTVQFEEGEEPQVVTDSEGNPIPLVDSQGHVVMQDSDWLTRVRNYVTDWPSAYSGGFVLGGPLGLARIPEYKKEAEEKRKGEARQQQDREQVGYVRSSTPVDIDALLKTSGISDMDRKRFDRRR